MLIPLPHKRVLNLPVVPFFVAFVMSFSVIHYFLRMVSDLLSLPAMVFLSILSLLLGLVASLPWFLLLRREGDDLVVRSPLRTRRLRIPGSRYQLRDRRLWLCGRSDNDGIALMPYPYERTERIADSLHRWLGLPAELDASFKAADAGMRRKDIFVMTWTIAGALVALALLARMTCDPDTNCSIPGVFSTLINGIRELVGGFLSVLAVALRRGS